MQEKEKRSKLTANQNLYTFSEKRRKTKEDSGKTGEDRLSLPNHYLISSNMGLKFFQAQH